jgi:hypothetical protein
MQPLIRRAQERKCAPKRATFSHKGRREEASAAFADYFLLSSTGTTFSGEA